MKGKVDLKAMESEQQLLDRPDLIKELVEVIDQARLAGARDVGVATDLEVGRE